MANHFIKLLIIYFFIVTTSIILFSFTITVGSAVKKYVYFRDEGMVGLLGLLIAIGVTIYAFFLALFACCVVFSKNYGVALVFLILMIVLFILQLVAGPIAYNDLKFVTTHKLINRGSMENYSNYDEIWDVIQSDLLCCGNNGPKDWLNRPSQEFPLSCCKIEGDKLNCTIENAFQSGCINNLREYIMSFADTIWITMGVLALVQIVGVFVTFGIARTFRKIQSTPLATHDPLITEINMKNIESQPMPTEL